VTDSGGDHSGVPGILAQTGGGYGIEGLQERAELLGGALSIESGVGNGTVVSVVLPIRRRSPTDQRSTESVPDETR
jgi:signal transduction histidine kinase